MVLLQTTHPNPICILGGCYHLWHHSFHCMVVPFSIAHRAVPMAFILYHARGRSTACVAIAVPSSLPDEKIREVSVCYCVVCPCGFASRVYGHSIYCGTINTIGGAVYFSQVTPSCCLQNSGLDYLYTTHMITSLRSTAR